MTRCPTPQDKFSLFNPICQVAIKSMTPTAPARIKTLRRALALTQEEVAARFRIPLGTLRDWEQGRSEPDQPAKAYLTVIARDPPRRRAGVASRAQLTDGLPRLSRISASSPAAHVAQCGTVTAKHDEPRTPRTAKRDVLMVAMHQDREKSSTSTLARSGAGWSAARKIGDGRATTSTQVRASRSKRNVAV
jgi:DNA-binding transcriptional regulator YiaG